MPAVTLTQRLLLATGLLSVAAAATVGYGVREAWRRAEEQRFQAEFRAALEPLGVELKRELQRLPLAVGPHCDDELVDSALVGLSAGDLSERRLSLSLRVPKLATVLEVDELWLVSYRGEVLGAHAIGLVGQRNPKLSQRISALGERAELSVHPTRTVSAACLRKDPQNPRIWVGLLAERRVDPVLEQIGKAYGMTLSFDPVAKSPGAMSERIPLAELGPEIAVTASRSRLPLAVVLENLDTTILLVGGVTVAAALALAALLSRGLARPMVDLARQASEVMRGEPRHIEARGPREIEESAAAFNRAIDDLTSLRKQLAASERIAAWREIARTVAHEIKNPLAPIRAAIETLRRLRARSDPAFDEYFDEATRTALTEVNRINQIVSEFTDFARLPAPSPSSVDLVDLSRSVVALHATGGAAVELDAVACPNALVDRNQIVQVLTNLVQNALDAVKGIPGARVLVGVAPAGNERVRVTVRDNGPGIAPELRDRLFQPYATNKVHGTGLGLAIAQRLVVEHGGEIGYRDAAGGGTEFWFELPLEGPRSLPLREGHEPPGRTANAT
ncbi:MAG TPA: ATP-binding protein [Polyangiaceae bacterium]|nr:ATP-binding protein [Polyangiaceae bacterium]